jgi:uncharacterized protein
MGLARCALLVFAAASVSCRNPQAEAVPATLKVLAGGTPTLYNLLGSTLAATYNRDFAEPRLVVERPGALPVIPTTVDSVDAGAAGLGFGTVEVAYVAYVQGTTSVPRPHRKLRGMAVLYPSVSHLIVRRNSAIKSITDLRGRRIGWFSVADPAVVRRLDLLLAAYHLEPPAVTLIRLENRSITEAFRAGVDAVYISVGYPRPEITAFANEGDMRLLEIERDAAARVRAQEPFLKPAVMPSGTYVGQSAAVRTIGMDNLLLCNADLSEDVVYRLTRAFFESLPDVGEIHPTARQIDPDRAAATPIPLHAGAARYYRERQLLR